MQTDVAFPRQRHLDAEERIAVRRGADRIDLEALVEERAADPVQVERG